jgi:hypothetical protein
MIRDVKTYGTSSIKVMAAACCLGMTLLVSACGTPVPLDYPAFHLTNAPDTDSGDERH